jgi:diguanylate cyclase (GGDEF)-like protein
MITCQKKEGNGEPMEQVNKYDELTGLQNMTSFFKAVDSVRDSIMKEGDQPAIIYVDFSGMKFFNANHGFAEGDKILQAFAGMLAQRFGEPRCCHIGADHFAAITKEQGLEDKLDAIINEFREYYDRKTPPVHVGIYPYRLGNVSVSNACDRAKLASTSLKGSYTSAYKYYSDRLREEVFNKQYIIENLDTAINEKWIQVYYQPIIRAVTGQICDLEALARWIDPEKGMLSPAAFIPVLEDAGLIYKLDLYVVDRVLELIKTEKQEGFNVVPHSINLSRSDFEVCDIVEEIRKRVDGAGISRDRITIEITESTIGMGTGFIKEQVKKFQTLGFQVWMDDFGSGYSSFDVLQTIKFDLIKFDMSFMKKLDEGKEGKIILTELMRMATSLGLDTVCEGVESESQVRFLQEIGCAKLQGFYFSKPQPFEKMLEMKKDDSIIRSENPVESDYYESIGRVNLFDIGVINSDNASAFQNTFSTVPIAVLEVKDDKARIIRCNSSFQTYYKRYYDLDIFNDYIDLAKPGKGYGLAFISAMEKCCRSEAHVFFEEKIPDRRVVHSFARQINVNPANGSVAVAVAVLSVSEPDDSTTYADIARSLAADYYNIYVVELDTDNYIEYSSTIGGEELSVERHGVDFFETIRHDAVIRVYEEDRESFLRWFTKENVLRELDAHSAFTTTFRLIDTGIPMYVNMKITKMEDGNRIILGISIIDAQMKQLEEEKRLRREKIALGRIASLSPSYIVLYTVDPETGHYTQYNASHEFERFGLARQGDDFFADVRRDAPKAIDARDMDRHLSILTKENMLREIEEKGLFIHNYGLIMDGKSVPVSLRASLIEEDDGKKLMLGVRKLVNERYEYELEMLKVQRENDMNRKAYELAHSTSVIYNHIAHALARGYMDLYYVNIETNELIEYYTEDDRGVLNEVRRGTDFFEGCERDVKLFVHEEDQEKFLQAMNRDYIKRTLEKQQVFELTYRRIKDGRTFYVEMKVSRVEDDRRFVVIAVSDIDELMMKRREERKIQEERIIYARLHALTGNFICVYVIDVENDSYREFSATENYVEQFSQAKEGKDFFGTVRKAAAKFDHPDDLKRFLTVFTKENVLAEVERNGIFTFGYRLIMDGKPLHVQMKAAMVEEKEGIRLIVGLNNIDAQVRQEEDYIRRLARARNEASIDALTGVKNKHAYLEVETLMDRHISEHRQQPFAIVMMDVNDLKKVNDTYGHQAGDQYLHDACAVICDIFKHSPVFRVGGDEFAVISQGKDYANIGELVGKMNDHNAKAQRTGGIVIACGMAEYENDRCVAEVFERADHKMYANKNKLKSGKNQGTPPNHGSWTTPLSSLHH